MKRIIEMSNSLALRLTTGIVTVVVLCALFFVLFSTRVFADEGDSNRVQGYEQILVRPGDTLDSLAQTYAEKFSHGTALEYKEQIVRINNLSSEYIQADVYLLMPNFKK